MEVPCPSCSAVLRVPTEVAVLSAGKRAKCKKCGHRFVLPGVPPEDAAADGSVFLSEADKPAAPPAGSPFGFDDGDAVVAVRKPGSTAKHKLSADRAAAAPPAAKSSKKLLLIAGGAVALVLTGVSLVAVVVVMALKPAAPVAEVAPRKDKAKDKAKEPQKATRPGGRVPPNEAVLPPIPPPPDENPPAAAPAISAKPGPAAAKPGPAAAKPVKPTEPAGVAGGGVAFDKLPTPPAGARKLVAPARVSVALDAPLDAVRAVLFSADRPQVVAVLWRSNAGFQGAGVKDTLDVYPATGPRVARLDLSADGLAPGVPRRLALSPDGLHVATELPAGKLSVMLVSSGKPVIDGVDPFADTPDAKGLAYVAFLDGGHVAVLDRAGSGQSWALATGKGVAGPPRPKRAAFGSVFSEVVKGVAFTYVGPTATRLAMTPAAVATADAAQPGASAGGFNVATGPVAVALDGSGKTLAAVFPAKAPADGFALLFSKLADATPPGPLGFPAAGPADDVRFVAGDTLLAVQSSRRAATTLFDTESRTAAAYVTALGPTLQYSDPDGRRLWWLLPDAKDAKKSRLFGANADFDDYQATLAEARAAKQPVALVVTEAGIEK